MLTPTVAVIIPTYNRWPLVARAIESVLAQSHAATECVVVDDGSTDGTPGHVRAQFGERVRRIVLPQNGEKSAARNAGIRAATAEYVCMLDSDDELPRHSVRDRLGVFLRDPAFNGVAYGFTSLGTDADEARRAGQAAPEGDVLLAYIRHPFVHNNAFLLSRPNMLQHGMYHERLTHREDKELLIRLAASLDFRCCGTLVNRFHAVRGSARMNYRKAAAQGLLMLESLRANPRVRERLGANFRLLEQAEVWEHLRDLYKVGRFADYRAACARSWALFAGRGKLRRRLLRRWIGSWVLQALAVGQADRVPQNPAAAGALAPPSKPDRE